VEIIDNSKLMFAPALNNIVAGATASSDLVEKERYIHDTLCAMNSYQANANISQSSYSALVFGSTMCAGYARAFQIACLRCGIPCYYVTGVSKDQNHAWNVVFINGSFYNVDITWDDCITDQTGAQAYSYFNKTTAEFSADHTLSDLSSQIGYL
jgi:transglutaminase/protease-like cytokinesis protein 3